MTETTDVIVTRSLSKFIGPLVLIPIGLATAIWSVVGAGTILYLASTAGIVLSLLFFVFMAISQRPRVVITPEGFVFRKLFGSTSHKWVEIDGQFAVINIGPMKCVGYK